MLKTLILGAATFRKGLDLYFERWDGHATTVEAFIACFADACGRDLSDFFAWYEQAGTPTVSLTHAYDAAAKDAGDHADPGDSPRPPASRPSGPCRCR